MSDPPKTAGNFGEPWEATEYSSDHPTDAIRDANGRVIVSDDCDAVLPTNEDCNRIVACVNALAGVPIEVIESGAIGNLLRGFLTMPVTVGGEQPLAGILETWLNKMKEDPPSDYGLFEQYEQTKECAAKIRRAKKMECLRKAGVFDANPRNAP
jgi:hypothetical protein